MAGAPILASSLYFELLWKHERVHCSIVHGREIKYFRNILTFYVDATLPRCLRRDWVPFRDLWLEWLSYFFFVFSDRIFRIFARIMQVLGDFRRKTTMTVHCSNLHH